MDEELVSFDKHRFGLKFKQKRKLADVYLPFIHGKVFRACKFCDFLKSLRGRRSGLLDLS